MRPVKLLPLCLCALACRFGLAGDVFAPDAPCGIREISLDSVLKASSSATAQKFPDADSVVLDSVTLMSYNEDGTYTLADDTYSKILTEKGRREESVATIPFNAHYGNARILKAQIIKGDGSVREIDIGKNSKVMTDAGMMSENIYDPNDKLLSVSYPGLETGDIVRLAFKRTATKARVPGAWSDYQVMESVSPILRYTYHILAPKSLPLKKIAIRDECAVPLEKTVKDLPSHTLYTWEAAETAQFFPEKAMPPYHTVTQRILSSTIGSWEELSRWYWNLCKPKLEATEEMRSFVGKLKEETGGDRSKLMWSLFTWVSQHVRYMGITTETEAPGYEPHDVATTFGKRYGVCRDKAALLVSLLRLAGFESYPALIHVGEKRDEEVPMTFFNHAIVSVKNGDGSYMLMDPTNENSADFLPAYLADKSFLPATEEGEKLLVSPKNPPASNMLFARSHGAIDENGTLEMETSVEFCGINDSAYRGTLARMSPMQRKTFFGGIAKRAANGAKLASLELSPEDLRDTSVPMTAKIKIVAEDFMQNTHDNPFIAIPWITTSLGYVNFTMEEMDLANRRFPFEIGQSCGAEETIDLELPEGYSVAALPENSSFKTNAISYFQRIEAKPGTGMLAASRRHEIEAGAVPAGSYGSLKSACHAANRLSAGTVRLEGPDNDGAPDQRILKRETVVDVESSSSWTVTETIEREILSYAGIKSGSEIKISFNPERGETELLEATVRSPGGTVHVLSGEETNLFDSKWTASAPRYTPGKILVATLPGVETGSVIRTVTKTTKRNAPFFSHRHVFSSFHPVDEEAFTVNSKTNVLIRPMLFNMGEIEPSVKTNGAVETVTFRLSGQRALPHDEKLPPSRLYAKEIILSDADPAKYAKMLDWAVKESVHPSNSVHVAAASRKLLAGLESETEKIKAIRDFVDKSVRLAGPAFTDLRLMPTSADTVLLDGYGNLFDRAVLLSAMLLEAGIDNRVVFAEAHPLEPCDEKTFTEERYSYPLVEVWHDAQEHPIYLNDTSHYAILGTMHHDSRLALAYPGNDTDEPPFLFLETPDHLKSLLVDEYVYDFDDSGNCTVAATNKFWGVEAEGFSRKFREMTPEKLKRHNEKCALAFSLRAVPGSFAFDDDSIPKRCGYSLFIPQYATVRDGIFEIDLPKTGNLFPARADRRTLPLFMRKSPKKFVSEKILLPRSFTEIAGKPEKLEWSLEGPLLDRVTFSGTTPEGRKCLTVVTIHHEREDMSLGSELYPSILKMNRIFNSPSSRKILLRHGK